MIRASERKGPREEMDVESSPATPSPTHTMSKPSARAPKVQRPERSQEEKMVYLRKSLKSQLVDGATTNALKTTDKSPSLPPATLSHPDRVAC